MATETKLYTVAGFVVEATKSEGGGFYDIKVVATGNRYRFLADVFEMVAKPWKGQNVNTSNQQ